MIYVYLIIGLIMLIKGADVFVDSASNLAKRLKVSPMIIGITIVAFGTSVPEAAVSFQAAFEGYSQIALGNVIGSNMINTTLVIGVLALISSVSVSKDVSKHQIPFILISTFIALILMSDVSVINDGINILSRVDGFILLALFIVMLIYIIIITKKNKILDLETENEENLKPLKSTIFFLIIGLLLVIIGGRILIDNSIKIAESLEISETLIGLTLIALGTSLPELVTSISAIIKKQKEIALGNIIGSNVFNLLFILGISSIIQPIAIDNGLLIDTLIVFVITSILLVFAITDKNTITKKEGFSLTTIYLVYLLYIFIR